MTDRNNKAFYTKEAPPLAKRIPESQTQHGFERVDFYAWLRAENWQDCVDKPELLPTDIKAYLNAENQYFESCMSPLKELRETLFAEMKARIPADDDSLPDVDGPWEYQERYRGEQEHPAYIRKRRVDWNKENTARVSNDENAEQVLIDFNVEAQGHSYFSPGDVEYSHSHTHLAWSADVTGSERYTLTIRNLVTGLDEDVIHDVESVVWGDAGHLFYTRVDADHRPSEVLRHTLGEDAAEDVLIYKEKDERFFCSVWTSLSQEYLFIGSDMNDQSEVWFIPTKDIRSEPHLMEARTEGLEYSVEHQNDRFLILTNADAAADSKLMETSCCNPAREHWQDYLPYQAGRMVLDVFAYKEWVMWMERENALPRLCYRHIGSDSVQRIEFEEEAYALGLEPLLEFSEHRFRFSYESPSTPERTYLFDMQSGERSLLKEELIPSGHNPADYCVQRRYAPSPDGEMVPLTILFHCNTTLDGSAPCWLTAYGAYGASSPATFSSTLLSAVDRGFVYAIAHVRGGQEKGRAWYEAARFGGKRRSVDDFIAVGRYLVENDYTRAGKIAISGSSAGGLLVGAALNRDTDLWGAAIADVPFVDALNTMLDDSLPLTPGEWSQWGNPIENEQAFKDIRAYSPYDNVQARPYPPMLVTAGVSDPRVTYWEVAKWVALHRFMHRDDNTLMFKTSMQSGHFGETGRYASLGDVVIELVFLLEVFAEERSR